MIFLDYSFFCYWNSFKRYRNNKGKSREDCPCIEKFDFEFQKWILWEGRTKAIRKEYQELLTECPNQTIVFHKRKEEGRKIPYEDLLKYTAFSGEQVMKLLEIKNPGTFFPKWMDEIHNGNYKAEVFDRW